MGFFREIFAWWTGNTIGTRLFTWRHGNAVGTDALGNVYYQDKSGARRWVIYKGGADASSVTPAWHGWLHHTVDLPPTEETYEPHPWQMPPQPNLTGTPAAYRPPGSTLRPVGEEGPPTRAYEPWRPE